jgi:hypothetical protein
MKIEKFRRTIPPPKGRRGKARDGLITQETGTAEDWGDVTAIANSTAPTYDPLFRMQRLLDHANIILEGLPGIREPYEILEDNTWRPAELHAATMVGLDNKSPLIARLSPQDYAVTVRLYSSYAIEALTNGDFEGAIIPIMQAHEAHCKMEFADKYEYQLTGKIASDKAARANPRANHWAAFFAKYLSKINRVDNVKPTFKHAIKHLVHGEQPGLYLGFEIYYDSVGETLSATDYKTDKGARSIKLETFRTKYYRKVT